MEEVLDDLKKRCQRVNMDAWHIFQFIDILCRDKEVFISLLHRTDYAGEEPIYSLDLSIQSKLTEEKKISYLFCIMDFPLRKQKQHRDSHRHIETRSNLFDI